MYGKFKNPLSKKENFVGMEHSLIASHINFKLKNKNTVNVNI